MVPFRSSRTRSQALAENAPNRTRAGQIDHDVFEGLPVRRWSRQRTTFSQTPKVEVLDTGTAGSHALPELPMPKDSQLLTPLSRSLLRAARAGCTYIKAVRKDPDTNGKEPKGEDSVGSTNYERTFTAVKWSTIPRRLEPPEAEFLAKRRPGLRSLYGAAGAAITNAGPGIANAGNQVQMRKTKFKKVDAVTGSVIIYEAWVPEGHRVEGEIADEAEITAENPEATIVSAAPAPGTVVEGVGIVDQEGVVVAEPEGSMVAVVRKRNPPPKRKAKGFSKGKRKKVMFSHDGADPSHASEGSGQAVTGQAQDSSSQRSDQPGKDAAGDEEEDEEDDGDGSEEEEEYGDESKPQTKSEAVPAPPELEDKRQGVSGMNPPDKSSSPELPLSKAVTERAETAAAGSNLHTLSTDMEKAEASDMVSPSELAIDTQLAPQISEQEVENQQKVESASDKPPTPSQEDKTSDKPQHTPPPSMEAERTPASIVAPTPMEEERTPATEPLQASRERTSSVMDTGPVRFEDGEVDLLGSLEASLDNPPQTFEEDKPSQEREKEDGKVEEADVTMTG
ncbi:predicted protein [Uncinocarpus reesii 1704]|uniref:Uncharacterized protein n=1 Tax=Uncinocarpus reesii (strain UAMH 1704) TaxID=336963 RepID=C4JE48_UNCRE|nr:uncharacterized protein UREG_00488 [Uncinocarpus reesii 1704]EEP75642.1 predicted protein [Uncinocarpus reesii 1704]